MPLKWRSIINITSAATISGDAMSWIQQIAVPAQEKIGARRQAIPGARMLRTVASMLIAKQVNPIAHRPTPTIQASTPWVGEYVVVESGGSDSVPALAGRDRKLG